MLAPGPFGGLERVVAQLCGGLSSRGHSVVAALLVEEEQTEEPGLVAALLGSGAAVELIRAPHRAYRRERALVRQLLSSSRPDLMHTHGYHADVLLRSVGQQVGLPVAATVHGFTGGGFKNRLFEGLQRRSLRRMDATVAVSRALADRLARSGVPEQRLHVVRNAYSSPGELLSRDEARSRLGLDPTAQVVGWVGRVTPEKGPDVMVEALGQLRTPGVELSIVGRGRLEATLKQRVVQLGLAGMVHWHGAVPDAWRLFRAFDAYCLSSHTEGTPIALFEAMAAAVPVVATEVGGVPDVVSVREAFLTPPGDAAALAAALDQALAEGRGARVVAASERLTREFGLDPWLDRYETIYRSITRVRDSQPR